MGICFSKCRKNDGLDDDNSLRMRRRRAGVLGCSLKSGTLTRTTLEQHFHILEQDATTRIALRIRPAMVPELRGITRPWIVMDFCCDTNRRTQNLFIDGDFDGVLRACGDTTTTSQTREMREIEKLLLFDIFLMGFKLFISNSDGRAWLNGFTMKLIGDPSKSFECIGLLTDPLRLTFKNKSVVGIEVIRSVERLELIGKPSGLGNEAKTLRIYGPDVSKIEAKATANDGTILLTFPPYEHNPDMEFVWPDYYYPV